jgi:FixJ family two-component response regulator
MARRSVAIVHDEAWFRDAAAAAIRAVGCDVTTYSDSMIALNGIATHDHIDVLVTRISFSAQSPNGASLALVLRMKYPALKVVFAARAEWEIYTSDIGELVPFPVDLKKLVEAVLR